MKYYDNHSFYLPRIIRLRVSYFQLTMPFAYIFWSQVQISAGWLDNGLRSIYVWIIFFWVALATINSSAHMEFLESRYLINDNKTYWGFIWHFPAYIYKGIIWFHINESKLFYWTWSKVQFNPLSCSYARILNNSIQRYYLAPRLKGCSTYICF